MIDVVQCYVFTGIDVSFSRYRSLTQQNQGEIRKHSLQRWKVIDVNARHVFPVSHDWLQFLSMFT